MAFDEWVSFTGAFKGGIGVNVVWMPRGEPLILANKLRSAAGAMEAMYVPLEMSKPIVQADIQERFDTKTDPGGAAWEPWSFSYSKYRESYPVPGQSLMHLTGELEQAATSYDRLIITGNDLFYSGAGLPSAGIAHQTGAVREPYRSRAGKKAVTASEFEAQTGISAQMNILPARPFIGLSEEAAIEIVDVFDTWFAGIVSSISYGGGGGGGREIITRGGKQYAIPPRVGGGFGPGKWIPIG